MSGLRTVRAPADPDRDRAGEKREFHHRWVVRGHWRQQACGPGREQRRPTWIMPHLKGPDDAPLMPSEHVQVWRR